MSASTGSLRAGASAVAATGASILPVALLGAVIVQLRSDIAVSTVELGGVIALFYLVSALGSIPAGGLIDSLGWPRSIWFATLCIVLPLLIIATVAQTVLHIAAVMVVAGVGNALAQPAANLAIIRGVVAQRQGIAFGVKQAAIPGGTLIAGAAVPLIALTIGWRWAFILPAVGVILLTIMTPLPGAPTPGGVARARIGGLVRDPALLALAAANSGGSMAINPTFAFFVESSVARGIRPGTAGFLLAFGGAMGVAGRLIIGFMTDRLSPSVDQMLRDMAIYALIGAPGFVILGTWGDRTGMVVVALVFALGFGFAWSGLFNLVVTRVWFDQPASATGVTQAGLWGGGMLGPLLFGAIAASWSYPVAWYVSALFLVLSSVALLRARYLLSTLRRYHDDS